MATKQILLVSLALSISEFMIVFARFWFQNDGSALAGLVMGLPTLLLSFLVFAGALLGASYLGTRSKQ
jgi:hypothetical protein